MREQMTTPEGLALKYTFSGSVFFKRMQALDLYTTDVDAIRRRVEAAGLRDVFASKTGKGQGRRSVEKGGPGLIALVRVEG